MFPTSSHAEQPHAGDRLPDWPSKGYSGPQPWEVDNSPELTHDRGFVSSGEAGADVVELCRLLGTLGYETDLSRGRNPRAIYGESERSAVDAFRQEWGVREDPKVIAATTRAVVGPWTWEALYRAAAGEAYQD